MEISEFVEATSRIESYFGKEYNKEQIKIMYDELKDFSIERYRKLISAVLRKSKYMPKIADFIEANKEEPYSQKQEEIEKVDCKKCNSTGYVVYKKPIKELGYTYEYGAICECGNSKQYKGWEVADTKHRSNYYTPMIKELGL